MMSLVTDSLTAGGTLLVTIGSGLQAYNELRRYQAVLERLGIAQAYSAYKKLARAVGGVYLSIFTPWIFVPVKYSLWHLAARFGDVGRASREYMETLLVVVFPKPHPPEGDNLSEDQKQALRTAAEKQQKAQQAEMKALGLKSLYWGLIMLGSLAVFVATCMAIFSDLKS
jgi:hypothetical protein